MFFSLQILIVVNSLAESKATYIQRRTWLSPFKCQKDKLVLYMLRSLKIGHGDGIETIVLRESVYIWIYYMAKQWDPLKLVLSSVDSKISHMAILKRLTQCVHSSAYFTWIIHTRYSLPHYLHLLKLMQFPTVFRIYMHDILSFFL